MDRQRLLPWSWTTTLAALAVTLGGIAANGAEAAQKTTIADKTLVAWGRAG